MSDVKKFTGFIAIDGSTHTSLKSATEHSRLVKIRNALAGQFGIYNVTEDGDDDEAAISLDAFIYANRDSILTALNQEVLTRKKRIPKAAKVQGTVTPDELAEVGVDCSA